MSLIARLLARVHGPLKLRLILQPLIATLFAVRDGRKDALLGRVPYFWALFADPGHRRELLRSGWKSVGKVLIIAVVLDLAFQYMVFKDLRPMGALIAGLVLALVPYLLLRGPVNRLLARRRKGERQ